METFCALFISAHDTARGMKSCTCQAVPSCSQPSLTESIYFWPASGLTFWAEERSVTMTSKPSCPSQRPPVCLSGKPCPRERAHRGGNAGPEVELWACPCLLCGLLHSVAFRAEGFFELGRKSSSFSPHLRRRRYFRRSLPVPGQAVFSCGPGGHR